MKWTPFFVPKYCCKVLVLFLLSPHAYCERVFFDLGSQPLEAALIEFSKQSNHPVSVAPKLVRNARSGKVRGKMLPQQALEKLLRKTTFTFEFTVGGGFAIFDKVQARVQIDQTLIPTDTARQHVEHFEQEIIEEIYIEGIRRSIRNSNEHKKRAFHTIDAISAEEFGKFPNDNLAESLQRVTGVAITRSRGGEGRFVTIRGLGEEFNLVTYNGRTLATENEGREFSFDLLPSELIASATVHKTPIAALGDGSIGGTVDVRSAKPLDNCIDLPNREGKQHCPLGSVSIASRYDSLDGSAGATASGVFSRAFDSNSWGVMGAFSFQQRDFRSDVAESVNYFTIDVDESGSVADPDSGRPPRYADARVTSLSLLHSEEARERLGAVLVFQAKPSKNVELTFDALYSQFESPAQARGVSFFPGDPETSIVDGSIVVNQNNIVSEYQARVNVDLLARSKASATDTFQLGLNAKLNTENSVLWEGDIAYSRADGTRDNTGSGPGSGSFYVAQVADGLASAKLRSFDVPDHTFTAPSAVDPSLQVPLEQIQAQQLLTHFTRNDTNSINDEIFSFKLVGEKFFSTESSLNFGADVSVRKKNNQAADNNLRACDLLCSGRQRFVDLDPNFSFDNLNEKDFLSDTQASLPRNFPSISVEQIERAYEKEYASILTPKSNLPASNIIRENIYSGYVQYDFSGHLVDVPWNGNFGLRLSHTKLTSSGHESDILSVRDAGQGNQIFSLTTPHPVQVENDYTRLLPSMNFLFDFDNEVYLRLALSRAISRPTLTNLSTANMITSSNKLTEARLFGNPKLDPPESNNFDLAVEWYGKNASASAALFYKDMSNFIANAIRPEEVAVANVNESDGSLAEIATIEFQQARPTNGDNARISGLEIAYQAIFDSGWGVLANITMAESSATVAGRKNTFENISDLSYNLSGFYEKRRWQARVSLNHRSGYAQTTIGLQGFTEFVDDFTQIDASIRYKISDKLTVFVEGINLTGEDFYSYSQTKELIRTYEDNEARYSLGLQASF